MENKTTFFARLAPHLSPEELLDVKVFYALAKFFHRHQFRKECDSLGRPVRYFEHARGAALIAMDIGGFYGRDEMCSILFHDGPEDTTEYDGLTLPMIKRVAGPRVARTVELVSKMPTEGYVERMEENGDWMVLLTKVSDRDHNIHTLGLDKVTPEFQARQIKETKEIYLPLFWRMLDRCPPAIQPGIRRIIKDIEAEIVCLEAKN